MSIRDAVAGARPQLAFKLDSRLAALSAAVLALALVAAHALTIPGGTWRMAALAATGAGIGFVLYRSTFGFTGAFRTLLVARDATAFKSHALLLGLAAILMLPLIGLGELSGQKLGGPATPIGVAFITGATLFGIGMQTAGGCSSGTMFALGGGNMKFAAVLAFFIAGSTLGALHMEFWWMLPALPPVVLHREYGWIAALAAVILLTAALWLAAAAFSKAPVKPAPHADAKPLLNRIAYGPWPLAWGAAGLALLNALTLALSGRPWGETAAFALWGSKLLAATGFDDPGFWTYWGRPEFEKQLDASIFTDTVSVMNIAVLLGAAIAAALSNTFRISLGGGWRAWSGAILGGFLMGYGARLSNGCNISAYFSSVSTANLSGFVWLAFALLGCYAGIKLRPLFGLSNTPREDARSP